MSKLTPTQLLKIGLLGSGVSITKQANRAIRGPSRALLTLADYASAKGITLELENNIFVNAPLQSKTNMAQETPYVLDLVGDNLAILVGDETFPAISIPTPGYQDKTLANGQPITHTTVTNTDKVKVSPIQGCAQACHFCDTPYTERYNKNGEERVIESIEIALRDAVLPGKHILIWGGTPKPEDYAYENAMYAALAAAFSEIPVEVMNVPMPGFLDAQELYDAGVDSLCINLELYNEDLAKKLMPNKFKASREGYFKFFEQAANIFGEGKVQSYLLVGLESMEDTLKGVEAIAQRGVDPVLSPFRPDSGTPLRDVSPASADFLTEVYLRSKEIVDKYGVALGPRCIPCQHNTLTFPDGEEYFFT